MGAEAKVRREKGLCWSSIGIWTRSSHLSPNLILNQRRLLWGRICAADLGVGRLPPSRDWCTALVWIWTATPSQMKTEGSRAQLHSRRETKGKVKMRSSGLEINLKSTITQGWVTHSKIHLQRLIFTMQVCNSLRLSFNTEVTLSYLYWLLIFQVMKINQSSNTLKFNPCVMPSTQSYVTTGLPSLG